jgi:hypothetical protein
VSDANEDRAVSDANEDRAVSDANEDRAVTRVEITGGGTPTPEQLAALVVALTPAAGAAPAAPADVVPAWKRAALREGTGGPRTAVPGELEDLVPRR